MDKPEVIAFDKAFKAKYGVAPNQFAAQGYDALHLLAHAILNGGSTVPAKMAMTLRSVKNWQGVTGPHTFDKFGDVEGKTFIMKMVKNGKFRFIEQPKAVTKGR
jgi:branched-chain amino acid transport system substrate-binding protein